MENWKARLEYDNPQVINAAKKEMEIHKLPPEKYFIGGGSIYCWDLPMDLALHINRKDILYDSQLEILFFIRKKIFNTNEKILEISCWDADLV